MPSLLRHRPSPGTALGFLALLVALYGSANASSSHVIIRKGDIAKGAVTAKAIAKGAVTSTKLGKAAVTSAKLKDGAVTGSALANDSVGPAALRKGAVTAEALGSGAVTGKALAKGAVSAEALAANAVTSSALAPGSVYGAALGPVGVHSTPIADLDEAADLSTWTTSNTETASCGPGERLLTGGVVFTNPGNRRVAIVRSLPFTVGEVNGVSGQITSDSGGTATAEVQAICLK
jgi:hypothetical protein